MFLAIKEIWYEKLRYSLVMALIFLVSYLLIILTGLSSGLANLNKSAVNEWGAKTIVLDKDSEGRLAQSFLSNQTIKSTNGTALSQYSSIVKSKKGLKENSTIIAVPKNSFVYNNLIVLNGKNFTSNGTALVSDIFKKNGFKIGDTLYLNNSTVKLRIVGFTPHATLSATPVVYTSFTTIRPLNRGTINAILTVKSKIRQPKNAMVLSVEQFINKLPGYSAQKTTFNFMIGFLYIIIFIVISIFLYILTIQKLPNYGVLKAQGIPTKFLTLNTVSQSLIISIIGVLAAILLGFATTILIPSEVPIVINAFNIVSTSIGVILMSLFGSIIPIYQIAKVDPYKVIGG
ncbi:ABC-type antimicrobial peptide transport system [Liquorilactobacillus sucicola DSM 21376 = JCM 15457]|uniref:Putative hemin transport system permease protein HrtB n=1 Tax=Liquorilactobacillus sucicola DSM 21376 = JCM 15457 TaxID=1423806 RepID=A0A023CZA8_9LACO|nr:FtsX-like permease family protein [Liquorilactobacillus sucicola]KRN06660.1 ABC superfamily ATP binding cassette transporter, membrane protein [Liquorilactobacillus sucicola DSM 21376 = JCM 15457]GAJ26926.1 ABC-type antimicrobial peptide transport system [Liquorilactobacillus sucicola DSM 21376 = JCM 15457]